MHGSAVNPTLDIIDTILAEASFRSLLSALQAAGMIDPLKGAGPFTVFAPTDEAFEKLAGGSIREWEKPENTAKLKALLESHVVDGIHSADEMRQRLTIRAISGEQYSVVASGATVKIGNANLQGHGIACTNGMIHVVDSVLRA